MARGAIQVAAALVAVLGAGAPGHAKTVTVVIEHFAFTPSSIEVEPGDTVEFLNRDIAPHTATAPDGSWSTPEIAAGKTEAIGVSGHVGGAYVCRFHPVMKGRIVVRSPH